MRALIAAGAEANARAGQGFTPLMIAAGLNKNPKVIEVLLDAGADGRLESWVRKTAFDYAKGNPAVRNTDAYSLLNEARF